MKISISLSDFIVWLLIGGLVGSLVGLVVTPGW
jgi:gas vesicle protein